MKKIEVVESPMELMVSETVACKMSQPFNVGFPGQRFSGLLVRIVFVPERHSSGERLTSKFIDKEGGMEVRVHSCKPGFHYETPTPYLLFVSGYGPRSQSYYLSLDLKRNDDEDEISMQLELLSKGPIQETG